MRRGGMGESARGPTWGHVEGGTASVVLGVWDGRRKAEVCKQNLILGYQNVLRLEIPMVDTQAVAVLHGFQDLEKCPADGRIVTDILTSLGDV